MFNFYVLIALTYQTFSKDDRMRGAPIFGFYLYLDLLFAFTVVYFVFTAVKGTKEKGIKKNNPTRIMYNGLARMRAT